MTDIRYLNDTSEYFEGVSEFKAILPELLEGNLYSSLKNPEIAIESLIKSLLDDSELNLSIDPIFTFSFSKSEDQLSQWRAYGKYAIQFDMNYIQEFFGNIHKCIYEKQEKKRCAKDHAIQAILAIDADISKNNGSFGIQSLEIIQNLREVIATFKSNGFSEENEYRAILPANDTEYPNNIKYRPKGDLLIPYIEVPISLDCIKGIKVGPVQHQELALESIAAFAENIERNWQVDGADAGIEYWLSVTNSDIPFRE